ncbi:MAG: hypothetical protein VXY90_13650, partial [Pseudomonadota bacterium]|nr:hypothetical protein [Pseudomonadota bacterium]MEC8585804.1 hypothetical protein [Pseudomonadota bacterium]
MPRSCRAASLASPPPARNSSDDDGEGGALLSLDVNGATTQNDDGRGGVLPDGALREVDVLHANDGEAAAICRVAALAPNATDQTAFCERFAAWAHARGVAVVQAGVAFSFAQLPELLGDAHVAFQLLLGFVAVRGANEADQRRLQPRQISR